MLRSCARVRGVDVEEVLSRLGGTARRGALLEHVSRRALTEGLRAGRVERLSRGTYALPRLRPVIKTAEALVGVVSHASAAAWWLMSAALEPKTVHVTVRPNAHRHPVPGVALHYAEIDAADRPGDGRVTGPARTVLDCARAMPFTEALSIADSALRRALVPKDELVGRAARIVGPGAARVARVVALADERAANPFESVLRALALEAGVGSFVPQVVVPGPPRRRVDLADERLRIVLEADSYSHHGSPSAFARDCRRYDELVAGDWIVLRFAWEHVMFHADWVVDVIRRLVVRRQQTYRRGG